MASWLCLEATAAYLPLRSSLHEIRLLIVEPGTGDEPLRCRLRRISLLDPDVPDYETISYCWGDANRQTATVQTGGGPLTIALDARDREFMLLAGYQLNVPFTSAAAIRRMRLPDRERTLWIDAVCINQADLSERGEQVAIMGQIYLTAAANLVFLGDDKDGMASVSTKALDDMISDIEDVHWNLFDEYAGYLRKGRYPDVRRDLQAIIGHNTVPILEIYALPWFRRLWIVQEAALAERSTCYWGVATFPLQRVLQLAWLLGTEAYGHLVPRSHPGAESVRAAADMWVFEMPKYRVEAPTFNILDVAFFARYMHAFDPRDHIFGLLQLFMSCQRQHQPPRLLQPDYRRTIAEVYSDATRYILSDQQGGAMVLLDLCNYPHEVTSTQEMPTWAYRFDQDSHVTSGTRQLLMDTCFSGLPPGSDKSTPKRLEIASSTASNILALRGFVTSEVVSHSTSLMLEELDDFETLRSLVESARRLGNTVASRGRADNCEQNVALSLLTASAEESETAHYSATAKAFEAFQAYLAEHNCLPPRQSQLPLDTRTDVRLASRFHMAMMTRLWRHVHFKMEDGSCGIGTLFTAEGDVIVIFKGATHPCIVRAGEQGYRLLGAAFIPGLMHGEVYGLDLPEEWIELI